MDNLFLGTVSSSINAIDAWTVNLQIANKNVKFQVDTGADVSCMPESVYEKQWPRPALVPSFLLRTSPAGPVNVVGKFQTTTTHKDKSVLLTVHVIKTEATSCLLDRDAAHNMGIVKFINENQLGIHYSNYI